MRRFHPALAFLLLFLIPAWLPAQEPEDPDYAPRAGRAERTARPAPRADLHLPTTGTLVLTPEVLSILDPAAGFLLGVENAALDEFLFLRDRRIALITDATALDTRGRHTAEHLAESLRFSLARVMIVETGALDPGMDDVVQRVRERRPNVSIDRLSRANYRPAAAQLADVDTIVFDLAPRGTRFATDFLVLAAALEEASLQKKRFVVFDRPPITGANHVEGPIAELAHAGTEIAFYPVPIFPGMTAGELARLLNRRFGIQADLEVIPMENWKRGDGTGWLEGRYRRHATEEGLRRLEILRTSDRMDASRLLLSTAAALARDAPWRHFDLSVPEEGGSPQWTITPVEVEIEEFQERLAALGPVGVDMRPTTVTLENAGPVAALALTIRPEETIEPAHLSLQVRYTGVPSVRDYPAPEDGGLYGHREPLLLFSRGRRPDQIYRRLQSAPEMLDFLRDRDEALLYQP